MRIQKTLLAAAICSSLLACSPPADTVMQQPAPAAAPAASSASAEQIATVADALAFLAETEAALEEQWEFAAKIAWVNATYITSDTDWLVARTDADTTEMRVALANATKRFEGVDLPPEAERKMNILRTGITLPAPSRLGAAQELAHITTWLNSTYATGKADIDGQVLGLTELEEIVNYSRDPEALAEAWAGWHAIAEPMAEPYEQMVAIATEGAQELGFSNLAEMWLSTYEMSPAAMEAEVQRLWGQVEPLYEALHCHVRSGLSDFYGEAVQPAQGPIRADLLGNMWAQQWSNIYDIVAPESTSAGIDVSARLEEKAYTPEQMAKTGEAFFTSLGFTPLPQTFWERSLFTQPRDREVVCHASAWDLDPTDFRIKMCIKVDAEDFQTIHHELGHNFYQRAYAEQDLLFRNGAHDGFHEAIGDFVALSITPEYLQAIGLIDAVPASADDTNLLLQQALDKIAFLPFGLLVDQWRWKVLRGEVARADYNQAWWDLRLQYQGIEAPVERSAAAFDPGAKYHIPGNTPYLRYFLAFIMQFQFHAAACEMAGWEGPLHRCSIYQNKEVGERLNAMLSKGASESWPDALEAFTGTREMDASAIIAYFEPLMAWLGEQNASRQCGW